MAAARMAAGRRNIDSKLGETMVRITGRSFERLVSEIISIPKKN